MIRRSVASLPQRAVKEMKNAKGEVKRLLKALDEIQVLAGSAKNGYLNDVVPDRYGKVVPPLDEICAICVRERDRFREIGFTEEELKDLRHNASDDTVG